jgi:Domain of unknown function (DUF4388)
VSPSLHLGGALGETSLPSLLRPLVLGKKTGILRLARGPVTKVLYLSRGRLIFATSTDPDDGLGERLLAKGLISLRDLEASLAAVQAGRRQGTALVESGVISAQDLVDGVTEQVQEIIHSVFLWEDGAFEFVEGDLPSREVVVLRMSTGELVLEGVRRIQAWSRIRAAVGDLAQKYALSPHASTLVSGMSLQKLEVNLIASLDGPVSVEEICAASKQPDFLVCRNLFGLWAAGVLDRIPQDLEGVPDPHADDTEPHAELTRGASVTRELERFNAQQRLLFELVRYELRDAARPLFDQALTRVQAEHGSLYQSLALDEDGSLDAEALRRNILDHEIATYLRGLDRLLEIEGELALAALGERKAAIIQDGLLALKEQQLESSGFDPPA